MIWKKNDVQCDLKQIEIFEKFNKKNVINDFNLKSNDCPVSTLN